MDIKPFITPDTFPWEVYGPVFWIAATVSLLIIIVGHIIGFKKDNGEICALSLVLGFFLFLIFNFIASFMSNNIEYKAYQSYQAVVQESLDKDGITVTSGSLDLHTNTESSVVLEYNGNNFECTVFTPKDVNKTIVFSCGETGIGLEQIKENKS